MYTRFCFTAVYCGRYQSCLVRSFVVHSLLRQSKDTSLSISPLCITRLYSSHQNTRNVFRKWRRKNGYDVALYGTAFALFTFAMSYAAVPLYRIYCQSTGKGGRATHVQNDEKVENMQPITNRQITVKFFADVNSQMAWNFKPTQTEVKVRPGETVLAFYTAKNPLGLPVNGIATYNVLPYEAGQYLNKIQCFCFEEQRLNPNEEVDLPIFFYFDPEYAKDPRLLDVDEVVLSYTFFEAKEGLKLPFIQSNTNSI
ncbi:cytochrome C oxidase assembly protein COX11-like protein [Leptotrombidium deliense]|uniref:Cytochrome c oxidase assembly protein COX11, mitochondrial n=1 Tax=Leptotrombidium deliense TaxID=299467 RepID=A0A443SEN3_9ACAR|nr:cytochrome C oxidase assembly protein COX11-like protein [Leptotrombidium deliense]